MLTFRIAVFTLRNREIVIVSNEASFVAESGRKDEFEADPQTEKTDKTFVLTQRARLSDSERRAGTRQLWRPCERQNAAQAAHYYREIASVRKLRSRNSNPASPADLRVAIATRASRQQETFATFFSSVLFAHWCVCSCFAKIHS